MDTLEKQFAALVKEQKSTIYSICFMFSKDKDEIDDLFQETLIHLFQETLIHLWQGFKKFRNESKIETWVYRVTMNTCISMDRKEKKRGERIPLSVDIDLFDENDKDMEQVQMLYKRIQKLGLFDRAIIMLWLENLSYDEIGEIVGISAKNVSVRLVRIREQLKKQ